ncbi:chemotaxis protein CheA [Rhodobacter sp. KR11]|jgi:two-component system chemotaxis sensor kinase CheA|uniref:chemotaxis protein CheA n=1 Tax=Rhodobacter sp. KR11 TaxID=2974588 RepID=UPI002222B501|nr:chemotaxis protein CheA [Rhodobacter sp. KR11]MCW1918815.1 chemotaxis protein CheA [Rhodobacter sp. KR11]
MGNPILDTFFEETEELLESLAEGLESMQGAEFDKEIVNSVFRAVHSIKGGAGAFKLNALVSFAHSFETVLDEVRSETLELTPQVMHTLIRSADHLTDLVDAARSGRTMPEDVSAGFLSALEACLGEGKIEAVDAWDNFEFAAVTLDIAPIEEPGEAAPEAEAASGSQAGFTIAFKPHATLYANGHEPALLFAALADLGQMTTTVDLSRLPEWDDLDPTVPHLSWTIALRTDESEIAVQEVFEFVHGLCDLVISPLADPTPPPKVEPVPVVKAAPVAPVAAAPVAAPEPSAPKAEAPTMSDRAAAAVAALKVKADKAEDAEAKAPKATLRVDLDRVDRLINAVGELIINQAMIAQRLQDMTTTRDDDLVMHIEDYRLLARDIQEGVMAIRAQPVKSLFQRMSRIVREAADATGKAAELVTSGEGTEVDKTVVERLADPLTHMIRNAVDHGLENREARAASGKPAMGTIKLSASHRSGSVIITVRDDGAGLNRPKILEIAKRKNLVPADAELSDSEIDQLLFMPGFSTAATVSNLSGRGVGLDVVRNAVTALGGRISIATTPGQGTEFTIMLPLTLAVMDGMVVTVGGQTLVVPITSIIETIRPQPSDLHRIGTDETLLSIRGRMIPVVDVARSLGFPSPDNLAAPLLLLVESESLGECALVVDGVQDQRQVVIKSLESNFGSVPGVSAATVLGDGRIALILDPDAVAGGRTAGMHMPNILSNAGRTAYANV